MVAVRPTNNKMVIQMRIPPRKSAEGGGITLQMPRWAPGSYRYQEFGDKVESVKAAYTLAAKVTGDVLVEKVDKSTWRLDAQNEEVLVTYSLPIEVQNEVVHWSGPASYLYVVNRKEEDCRLNIVVPAGWNVMTGLDPVGESRTEYTAKSYDVLADNPVSAGNFIEDTYRSHGKPHYIVIRGANRNDIDRDHLRKLCKFVTESQANFFGNLPYNRYVWHFSTLDSRDGGFGLEHLSSTQIGLATGVGQRAAGLLSHEFFHLWNVKRIRSKPLGPFNYQELPQTGALWWLEGVTDYYGHLLNRRYGWSDDARFYSVVAQNIRGVRSKADRLKVSPYEASFRVRDAANGRGNSDGFGVSYYNTGFLLGLCLDIELRAVTNGANDLDDVERALYDLTRNDKPGFEEDAIRSQLVRFGGAPMGDFYDKLVTQPGELPVEEQLAKIGLKMVEVDEAFSDLGATLSASKEKGGIEVRAPKGPTEGKLIEGDLIVAIDGVSLTGASNRRLQEAIANLAKVEGGKIVKLMLRRGTAADPNDVEVEVTPVAATRKVQTLAVMPEASLAAVSLRTAWLTPPPNWKPRS